MKKFAAIVLVLLFSCLSVGCAEQSSTVCPCLCCQSISVPEGETDEEPMTYAEWLDFAWPLLENCYNMSTWVKANNVTTYTKENNGMWIYVDASFLLLDDIRCASAEQIDLIHEILTSNPFRDSTEITNMYKFIRTAPSICEIISTTHSKIVVPEEYAAIDEMFMRSIEQIESIHTSIVTYIIENGTTEKWAKITGTLEDDVKKIELLYGFLN